MGDDPRIPLAIGARLHMSAAAVEALSRREIVAWLDFFTPPEEPDPVPTVQALDRNELRAMFRHVRRK